MLEAPKELRFLPAGDEAVLGQPAEHGNTLERSNLSVPDHRKTAFIIPS